MQLLGAQPECDLDSATIVDAIAIGLLEERPGAAKAGGPAPRTTRSGKPTKSALKPRVRELEAEVERLKEGLIRARRAPPRCAVAWPR